MYEPNYLPLPNTNLLDINGIRFGIIHVDKFVDPKDPNRDPLHIHKQLEIFFNIDSDISFLVNNHLYTPLPGSAVISKENDLHVCIFNKAQTHSYYCLWIDGDFSTPLFSFLGRDHYSPLFSFDEGTSHLLQTKLKDLYQLYQKNASALGQTALLLDILYILEANEQTSKKHTQLPTVLQTVLDDIHENFATMNSVSDIIENHYISPATLNRYFRKYIHSSPHEYLESQKLSFAARLLAEGHSVTNACMTSGFSDCSRFIVLFKRKFNITPMQYKRKFLS